MPTLSLPPPPTNRPPRPRMSGAVNKNGLRDVETSVGRPRAILKLTQDELHYIL